MAADGRVECAANHRRGGTDEERGKLTEGVHQEDVFFAVHAGSPGDGESARGHQLRDSVAALQVTWGNHEAWARCGKVLPRVEHPRFITRAAAGQDDRSGGQRTGAGRWCGRQLQVPHLRLRNHFHTLHQPAPDRTRCSPPPPTAAWARLHDRDRDAPPSAGHEPSRPDLTFDENKATRACPIQPILDHEWQVGRCGKRIIHRCPRRRRCAPCGWDRSGQRARCHMLSVRGTVQPGPARIRVGHAPYVPSQLGVEQRDGEQAEPKQAPAKPERAARDGVETAGRRWVHRSATVASSSPSATRCESTVAAARNFQIPRFTARTSTVRITTSPGTTGLRNRILSTPRR